MKPTQLVIPFALLISLTLLCGCSGTHQGRSVNAKSAILVNPDLLQKGTGDEALYRYIKPGFNISRYSTIMVEPVLIAKEGELSASERESYQKLANNAYIYLIRELEKEIEVVTQGGTGTLNLQMAIRDADTSKPVRMITSSATPIGAGLSLVKFTTTGKQSGVGEITAEFRLTDNATGELLIAALDRRIGEKNVQGIWDTWYHADTALQYWAKQIGFLLCTQLKQEGCRKP